MTLAAHGDHILSSVAGWQDRLGSRTGRRYPTSSDLVSNTWWARRRYWRILSKIDRTLASLWQRIRNQDRVIAQKTAGHTDGAGAAIGNDHILTSALTLKSERS